MDEPNLPSDIVEIPQYAFYKKSKLFKIPCIVIQAEGKNNAVIVGFKNLLTGENDSGWIDEFEFYGKTHPIKKKI